MIGEREGENKKARRAKGWKRNGKERREKEVKK